MSESREHQAIIESAARWLRYAKRCEIVLVNPRHPTQAERPDVIGWDRNGRSYVVEAKASVDDLRNDHRKHAMRVGLYRYYAAPAGVWRGVQTSAWMLGQGMLTVERGTLAVNQEASEQQGSARLELAWLMWAMATGGK